jgi:hypothetical protein
MGILQEILLFSFLVFSWKQSNVKLFIASQDLYQIILWKVVPYSILHCLSVGSVHLFPSKATYLNVIKLTYLFTQFSLHNLLKKKKKKRVFSMIFFSKIIGTF